jgi:GNAT superfamily N-acetyltransferase
MKIPVTTWYLEMTAPTDLRPARASTVALDLIQALVPCPELNRFFYTAVGGDWFWTDRLPWTYEEWLRYLDRPELETWTAWRSGSPAGYFELERLPATGVEIVYFGILPQFIGQGLGGRLLTAAVERAWQLKPHRVWLHTCTLDHPKALANYRARGFRLYREETKVQDEPDQSPGPWPGANRPTTAAADRERQAKGADQETPLSRLPGMV